MTDTALVQRALSGDAHAFTTLVDRHAPACLRFATRMLGNREDAEDVTQETLLRAYRALGHYDSSIAFRTWLTAILLNRCRTAMLQRHRRDSRLVLDATALEGAAVDATADAWMTGDSIARALQQLDHDEREAFLLKHVELLTYDEIAAATGVGVSALKMRVKRACARLRAMLEDDHAR